MLNERRVVGRKPNSKQITRPERPIVKPGKTASLVFALDVLDDSAEVVKGTLVLGASLPSAVAEMGPVGFRLRLGDGLGDGVRCTLDLGASLAPTIAEAGPVGLCSHG